MRELFPDSERILIAGCTAGGAGTIGASAVVRLQFPNVKLYVLNISRLGLADPEKTEILGLLMETWNTGQFIPADCPRCDDQLIYTYAWLLERAPSLKVGLFSLYQDADVRSIWVFAPDTFETSILDTTEMIHTEHPETFKRNFITGDAHCIEDYSYRVDGHTIWDWIGHLVNDDPGWVETLE